MRTSGIARSGLKRRGGAPRPAIVLSTPYQAENTTIGTTIGTLSVVNASTGSSGWTFAKTVDANSAFTLSTATVSNAIAYNYETATSYSATYTATKAGDPASPITQTITVSVTNVFEAASLSALTGTFSLAEDAAANAVAGAISGKTSGSTLSLVDDAGGRVALSGTNIVRGATALDYETATSHSFTIRETLADSANSPRDTVLSLTVTNVLAPAAPSLSLSAGNGQVTVSWTDSGATATSHKLYRGTSSGSETLVGTIMTGSPYTDTGLTNGTTYYYKLSAVNAEGETLSSEQSATPANVTAPTGFALNGSTNTALKAMLARVAGGSGRGRIVMKGDSTTAGAGASIVSGTGDIVAQLTNARPYRPSAVLASELNGIGYAALDNAFVNDQYCAAFSVGLPIYDPRVALTGTAWSFHADQTFAGGGFILSDPSSGSIQFTPTTLIDTFVLVMYNTGGTYNILIDGSNPASITAPGCTVGANTVTPPSGTGFSTATITVASAGTHTIDIDPSGSTPVFRSVMAYNSAAKAIDIINHASSGAKSGEQAASNNGGNNWSNNEALGLDAPDLTIINLGLNDGANSVSPSTYTTNLQAIITKAKLSGDVLLVAPNPANPSFSGTTAQTDLRDAAATLAASNNVAFMDLYTYFTDWTSFASRSADNTVHPNRGAYAEIAQVYRQCIQVMAQ